MPHNRISPQILLFLAVSLLISDGITGQKIQQQIPITISENLIYVPVRINGHGPYNFMLDSDVVGLGNIDQRLAKKLGLNIVGFEENRSGTQVKRGFLVGLNKFSLGQVAYANLKMRVADYNTISRQIPIDGIVGRDFFADYLLSVDGPNRRLTISQAHLEAEETGVLRYTNAFLVPGRVGQRDMVFNLDTGSDFSLLFPASSLTGIHYTNTSNQRVVTQAAPPFTLQEAVVTDDIVLGGVRVNNQKIYYSDKAHQINVGVDFLKEHVITIDQRTKQIRIE